MEDEERELFDECCDGNLEEAMILLKKGLVPVDWCTFSETPKTTCLVAAARSGHADVLALLLEQPGVDVNATEKDGGTALQAAVRGDHENIVKLLVDQPGIDLNTKSQDYERMTALHYAAEKASKGVVEFLLSQPAVSVNERDHKGKTPLHIAVTSSRQMDQEDVVRLLLDHPGIQVNLTDYEGHTALHDATIRSAHPYIHPSTMYERSLVLLSMLLNYFKTDINAVDLKGQTVLHYAADGNKNEPLSLLLQQPGLDLGARDNRGQTALHLAAWGLGSGENAFKLLLDQPGVDVQALDIDGCTALHNTCKNLGNLAALKELLSHPDIEPGEAVKAKDNFGSTPMHYACNNGTVEPAIVRELLNFPDTDPNLKNLDGYAPITLLLHYHICRCEDCVHNNGIDWMDGTKESLKALLESGRVDLDIKDQEGLGLEELAR